MVLLGRRRDGQSARFWRDRAVYLEGLLDSYRRRVEELEREREQVLRELRALCLEAGLPPPDGDPAAAVRSARELLAALRCRVAELEASSRGPGPDGGEDREEFPADAGYEEVFSERWRRLREWAARQLDALSKEERRAFLGVALGYYSARLVNQKWRVKEARRVLDGLVERGLLRFAHAVRSNNVFRLYLLSPAGEAAFASRAWEELGVHEAVHSFRAQYLYALSRTKRRELYRDRALVEALAEKYRRLGYEVYTCYTDQDAVRLDMPWGNGYLDVVAVRGRERVGVECETLSNDHQQTVRTFQKLLEYNNGAAYVVVPSQYAKNCMIQRAAYAAWVLNRSILLRVATIDEAPASWIHVHILREPPPHPRDEQRQAAYAQTN